LQIIPEKKAILLRLKDPNRVIEVIPQAKVIQYQGKPHVALPHQIEVVQVLRNLGINAPSPISYYYTWSGRFKPFEHQRQIAEFLTLHNRAFNLGDMGTGKTLATLWAYDYLRSRKIVRKALVITPLSTLEQTWGNELFGHFPHLDVAVLHGTRDKRLKMLQQDADVYLINHDGIKVSGMVDALKNRPDIDLVIVDEIAQIGRTAGAQRFRVLNTILNNQVPRRAWGLTGAPIPNNPTDAWAQCRLLVPKRVPPYFNRFRDQVMRQVGPFTWVARDNALEVVQEVMQPAIRFHRDECIDLPPCMYEMREAPLSKEQQAAFKDMVHKLHAEVEGGQVTAVNEAVKAQKLIQIACLCYDTPVLTDGGWVPIKDVTSRHRVWDGEEWVRQDGAVYMGDKVVTSCFNVLMTEDHKVLTSDGWVMAKEVNRERRAEVRLPGNGWQGRARSVVCAGDVVPVYDLLNCGPRNRFVVLGSDMNPLIVHNCGTAYGDGGDHLTLDATPRMNVVLEVVEQSCSKVIVFVPFRGVVEPLRQYLEKHGHTTAAIHGSVSKEERDQIFSAFQRAKDPRVLVSIPQTMSHGLTLTAASTIVWYAPTTSADVFGQANARITRPGQKHSQLIVMVEGTAIERKYFQRLKEKETTQGVLLDLIKADRLC